MDFETLEFAHSNFQILNRKLFQLFELCGLAGCRVHGILQELLHLLESQRSCCDLASTHSQTPIPIVPLS